jgi:hypothetical protein
MAKKPHNEWMKNKIAEGKGGKGDQQAKVQKKADKGKSSGKGGKKRSASATESGSEATQDVEVLARPAKQRPRIGAIDKDTVHVDHGDTVGGIGPRAATRATIDRPERSSIYYRKHPFDGSRSKPSA